MLGLFGVVALAFSAQVGRRLRAGDLDGARRASARARTWAVVGIVVFVLWAGVVAANG